MDEVQALVDAFQSLDACGSVHGFPYEVEVWMVRRSFRFEETLFL